jgi:hypothetical protein
MKIWELYKGDILLGKINQNDSDFPWFYGEFYPEEAFEKYKSLFERTAHFSEIEDWESEESENAFQAVDDLRLKIIDTTDSTEYEHVLFNVEGSDVSWRCYSDNEKT